MSDDFRDFLQLVKVTGIAHAAPPVPIGDHILVGNEGQFTVLMQTLRHEARQPLIAAEEAMNKAVAAWPVPDIGARYRVDFDGFVGTVIGSYQRLDGEEGVVMQQDGCKVVHVYRRKWLVPV